MSRFPLLGACCAFLCTQSAVAAILVDEQFADGNRSGNTPPSSLQWTYGAHRTSTAFTSLSVASNQMVWDHTSGAANSFSAVWGHFTASGSPTTLAVGETLKLSFNVSFSGGVFSTATGGFRWALFNSNGSRVATDFAGNNETGISSGSSFNTWRGYEGQTIVHNSTVNASGFVARERTGSGAGLFTSSNWTAFTGSAASNATTAAASPVLVTLELTRTAGGMEIQAGYNGALTILQTDTTTPFTAFDTIAFFTLDGLTHDVILSNIELEVIPEPSAVLLAAVGLIGIAFRRRR